MGYTHRWKLCEPISSDAWDRISSPTRALFKARTFSLRGPPNSVVPVADRHHIYFNGPGNFGCEDFLFSRQPEADRWQFCKTQYLPYDGMVCCVLAIAAMHTNALLIDSDGDVVNWRPHLLWAESVLNYAVPMPAAIRPAAPRPEDEDPAPPC